MTWTSVFNLIKALGQLLGLARDAKQVVVAQPEEVDPNDAAKQRAGTAAGAAAYSAGKRAGKEK